MLLIKFFRYCLRVIIFNKNTYLFSYLSANSATHNALSPLVEENSCVNVFSLYGSNILESA